MKIPELENEIAVPAQDARKVRGEPVYALRQDGLPKRGEFALPALAQEQAHAQKM